MQDNVTEQKRACNGWKWTVAVSLVLFVGVLAALVVLRKPKELSEVVVGSEKEDVTHPFTFYDGCYTLEIPGSWEVSQKEHFKVFEVPPGTEGVLRPKRTSRTWLLVQVIPLTSKELMGVSDKETVIGLLRQYCLLGDDSKQIFWHYEKYSNLEQDYIMLVADSRSEELLPLGMDIFPHENHTLVFTSIFEKDWGQRAKDAPYIVEIIASQKYRENVP